MDSENMAPSTSTFGNGPAKLHNAISTFGKVNNLTSNLGTANDQPHQRKALCPVADVNEIVAAKKKKELATLKTNQGNIATGNVGTLKPLNSNNVQTKFQGKGVKPTSGSLATNTTALANSSTISATTSGPGANFSIYCDESFESLPEEAILTDDDDDDEVEVIECQPSAAGQDRSLKEILDTSNLVLPDLDSPVMSTDVSMEKSELDSSIAVVKKDPSALFSCEEYRENILTYMLRFEKKFLPNPAYMLYQLEINHKMRSILIDWMVEVTEEYKLSDETLFLAIAYVDRYLTSTQIERQTFQLLGTACLFIASKYEEIYPPDINEFVYVTDDSYTKAQVLQMEMTVLKVSFI